MNIPKGTASIIFKRANELYLRHAPVWLKISFLFWVVLALGQFAYLDNEALLFQLDQAGIVAFRGIDMIFTVFIFIMLCVVLIATMIVFEQADQKKKISPLWALYRTSFSLLIPLLTLKIRYVFRFLWKLFLLIIPGVFALADGVAYSCAFLYDQKRGQEAIDFSDRVVRVNRNRYWDYLLMGGVVVLILLVPFVIFLDQIGYVFHLREWMMLEVACQGLKYVAAYMALIYILVFHYVIYQTFKGFLTSGENSQHTS